MIDKCLKDYFTFNCSENYFILQLQIHSIVVRLSAKHVCMRSVLRISSVWRPTR